jgi:hypothetical protein
MLRVKVAFHASPMGGKRVSHIGRLNDGPPCHLHCFTTQISCERAAQMMVPYSFLLQIPCWRPAGHVWDETVCVGVCVQAPPRSMVPSSGLAAPRLRCVRQSMRAAPRTPAHACRCVPCHLTQGSGANTNVLEQARTLSQRPSARRVRHACSMKGAPRYFTKCVNAEACLGAALLLQR